MSPGLSIPMGERELVFRGDGRTLVESGVEGPTIKDEIRGALRRRRGYSKIQCALTPPKPVLETKITAFFLRGTPIDAMVNGTAGCTS